MSLLITSYLIYQPTASVSADGPGRPCFLLVRPIQNVDLLMLVRVGQSPWPLLQVFACFRPPTTFFILRSRPSIIVLVIVKIMSRHTSPDGIGHLGPGGPVRILLDVVEVTIPVGQRPLHTLERQEVIVPNKVRGQ
jgi:hypothetical protein